MLLVIEKEKSFLRRMEVIIYSPRHDALSIGACDGLRFTNRYVYISRKEST